MKELRPTLWRTCRVLSNPVRLDLIRLLLSSGKGTVADLAASAHLAKGVASASLRAINARGLAKAIPQGRYVFYSPEPNPAVEHADEILLALNNAFQAGLDNEAIIRAATAFTHKRRIEIVSALENKTMATSEIMRSTGISMPALARHLRKLASRNLIESIDGNYKLKTPDNIFAHSLLLIALS